MSGSADWVGGDTRLVLPVAKSTATVDAPGIWTCSASLRTNGSIQISYTYFRSSSSGKHDAERTCACLFLSFLERMSTEGESVSCAAWVVPSDDGWF